MESLPDWLRCCLNDAEDQLVVECAAEVGEMLRHLKTNQTLQTYVDGTIGGRTIASRESTPTVQPEARAYFVLRRPRSCKTGFTFGHGVEVDFHLPKTRKYMGISGVHFRIFVNAHRSWMLADVSRNGTSVDGEYISSKGRKQARWSQVALHPKKPNYVKVADLPLTIYPVGDTERLNWILENEQTALSDLEGLNILSEMSGSTMNASSVNVNLGLTVATQSGSEYYIMKWDHRSMPNNTRKVIFRNSGLQGVGKVYIGHQEDHARQQYNDLYMTLKNSNYFISFLSFAFVPIDKSLRFTIITQYRYARSLEQLMEEDCLPEAPDLILLYGQIGGGALKWLEKSNIIHRNIRPAVILVDDGIYMSARLTGFSEYSMASSVKKGIGPDAYAAPELKAGRLHDTKVDVYALSATVQECLSVGHPGTLPDDSQIAELIAKGVEGPPTARPTPSDIYDTLYECIGSVHLPWPPFSDFFMRRKFSLEIDRHNGIAKAGLFTTLCALVSDSSKLPHFSEPHIPIRRAVKICHDLQLSELENLLLEALTDNENPANTLYYTHNFKISYHTPTLMVNLTQVLHALGSAGSAACGKIGQPSLVEEVYGVSGWEGIYVEYDTIKLLFARMPKDMAVGLATEPPRLVDNPILGNRFRMVNSAQYIILITRFLNPHSILVRRSDGYINVQQLRGDRHSWDSGCNDDGSFISPGLAIATCGQRGLDEAQETIKRLADDARLLDWKRVDISPVPVGYDFESITSVATPASLLQKEMNMKAEQETNFRFRRRPKPSIRQTSQGPWQKRPASDELEKTLVKQPMASSQIITNWLEEVERSKQEADR